MTAPRYAGPEVVLGGTVYTAPPLAIGALRTLEDVIPVLAKPAGLGSLGADKIDASLTILHASIRRNLPALTREAFAETIAISEIATVVATALDVLRRSGFGGDDAVVPAVTEGNPTAPATTEPPSIGMA